MSAEAFDCGQCGRRIGKDRAHHILTDGRVVCTRHHDEHYDTGRIAFGFCSRAAARRLVARTEAS